MQTTWRRFSARTIVAISYFLVGATTALSDEPGSSWDEYHGKRPPVTVVTPATGPFAEKHPFNKEGFGKSRGFCPANAADGNAVMIYIRELTPKSIAFLSQVESAMEANPKWNETFVHLFETKGAQIGGYTADELSGRISELESLATDNHWKKISIGIAANPSGEKAGHTNGIDLAVVFLSPDTGPKKKSLVRWHAVGNLEKTDSSTIKAWLETIEKQMN